MEGDYCQDLKEPCKNQDCPSTAQCVTFTNAAGYLESECACRPTEIAAGGKCKGLLFISCNNTSFSSSIKLEIAYFHSRYLFASNFHLGFGQIFLYPKRSIAT